MFYDTRKKNDHGLPHDPFKAIVAPRPIGWITSMSAAGDINLAPYSWFNGVSSRPPMVMFASEERKDSLTFIEETKEFVVKTATTRANRSTRRGPFPLDVNEIENCRALPQRRRHVIVNFEAWLPLFVDKGDNYTVLSVFMNARGRKCAIRLHRPQHVVGGHRLEI